MHLDNRTDPVSHGRYEAPMAFKHFPDKIPGRRMPAVDLTDRHHVQIPVHSCATDPILHQKEEAEKKTKIKTGTIKIPIFSVSVKKPALIMSLYPISH